ncbi:hypothetical protein HanPSC8_Chr11g0463651 [Helianthus annuus]|nr:hypothetical protein HanPSC8_Chr11g0463651 [Helianthus annuus]
MCSMMTLTMKMVLLPLEQPRSATTNGVSGMLNSTPSSVSFRRCNIDRACFACMHA